MVSEIEHQYWPRLAGLCPEGLRCGGIIFSMREASSGTPGAEISRKVQIYLTHCERAKRQLEYGSVNALEPPGGPGGPGWPSAPGGALVTRRCNLNTSALRRGWRSLSSALCQEATEHDMASSIRACTASYTWAI